MFEQLEAVRTRYQAITERLADPAVHADLKELQKLGKEQAQLRDLVTLYEAYRRAERGMAEARELSEHERDPEMQAYARQEFEKQQAERNRLEGELKLALVPKDPTDDKDVIIEIRQGTGGDEGGVFCPRSFFLLHPPCPGRGGGGGILSWGSGGGGGGPKKGCCGCAAG